jgi:hypothetical protein
LSLSLLRCQERATTISSLSCRQVTTTLPLLSIVVAQVVVRATAAGVHQGAQGAALHCHAQEALGAFTGTTSRYMALCVRAEPSLAQGAGHRLDERRDGLCM